MRLHPFLLLAPLSVVCVERFASQQNCSLDLWVVEKAFCKFWCTGAVDEYI